MQEPLTLRTSDQDPMLRQQLVDLARSLRRQARQHIFEIRLRIMPIHASRPWPENPPTNE